jgi:hypothetical protein
MTHKGGTDVPYLDPTIGEPVAPISGEVAA